jgi:hypothetical protein
VDVPRPSAASLGALAERVLVASSSATMTTAALRPTTAIIATASSARSCR